MEGERMIDLDPTDRITICGIGGTGKTTFTKHVASLFIATEDTHVVIYDPLAQYVKKFGTLEEDGCVYIPRSDSQAEFEGMCQRLCAVENHTFIVEEAERYLRQGISLGSYAFDLINRGRNWGNGVVAVTRRIQTLSKDFFDLSQYCFFFKCGLTSRDYVENLIGREAAKEIFGLKEYHFLAYDIEKETYEIAVLDITTAREHIETPEEEEEKAKPEPKTEEKVITAERPPLAEEEEDHAGPPEEGKV